MTNKASRFGTPVIPRWQLDPRKDQLGLYLWGTVVWFLVLAISALALIYFGHLGL